MTCGCSSPELRSTRAAACYLCAGVNAKRCPVSRASIALHVNGRPCPRGKHPRPDGIVRWLGREWFGLSFFQRAWLWTTEYSDRDWHDFKKSLPGCGCWRWAKVRWERLRAKMFATTNFGV